MDNKELLDKLNRSRTIREAGVTKEQIVEALMNVGTVPVDGKSETVAELKSENEELRRVNASLKETNRKQRVEIKKLRNGAD